MSNRVSRAIDWYGERGVQLRTFWLFLTTVVVMFAALSVIGAKNDVNDLLARQAADDAARQEQVEQGTAARKQQCAVTPIFVKALDFSNLTEDEAAKLHAALDQSLAKCPK